MSQIRVLGRLLLVIGFVVAATGPAQAQTSRITPGKVVVPVGKGEQRLMLGELISLDLKNRTGSFRPEGNDKVMSFTILPYAELAHHAANCDLQDFQIGERALFRLHQDQEGNWTWLTYIGDEMAFLKNHLCYFWVDAVDPVTARITISRGNLTKTDWGEKEVVLHTDADTRYWKSCRKAVFQDIQVGDKLRIKTHWLNQGALRVCWDVFLDDESFQKFQDEQRALHLGRMETEGLTAYIDSRDEKAVTLTLFSETREVFKTMTSGQKIRLAVASVDRKPTGKPITGTVTEIKPVRKLCQVAVTLDAVPSGFSSPDLVRVWLEK